MSSCLTPFLCRFFEDNPSYQSHFPFRDVHSWEELSKDKRLKAHAANVMYYLSMMIQNIDDTEVFVEMVEKIARSHIRRKLSVEHFESLKKTLVKVLVQALGESVMTEEAITAWAKAYATITDTIDRQATHSSE